MSASLPIEISSPRTRIFGVIGSSFLVLALFPKEIRVGKLLELEREVSTGTIAHRQGFHAPIWPKQRARLGAPVATMASNPTVPLSPPLWNQYQSSVPAKHGN